MAGYHIPVLGREVCDMLLINSAGTYYDGTLGGGGHALLFLVKLDASACYIGVDRDPEAIAFAKDRLKDFNNVSLYRGVFSDMGPATESAGVKSLDGILLDLGVSSHQINEDRRGFAFRPGLRLDMRMDEDSSLTAAQVLSEYEEDELATIFKQYGEERHSRRIAKKIVQHRQTDPVITSDHLMKIISACVPGQFLTKSYARIFQALRIEVNGELVLLQEALDKALTFLNPGGRIGVISYHSLEDRIVKNFMRQQENPCSCPPELPYCICGKQPALRRVKPFLVVPGESEIKQNPRARSAKFRVGEKI